MTGELPFRGNSRMLLHQVLNEEPRPPRRLNDRIPKDLETVVLKAMAKDPAQRYRSAGDLSEDLRRFMDGRAVLARPVGRLVKVARWARRNRAQAVLAATAVVGLVATAAVSLLFAVYERRTASVVRNEKVATEVALTQSRRLSADLMLDRGLVAAERGDVPRSLHWMARSLELAPPGSDDLQRYVRTSLAQWLLLVHPLHAVLPHPDSVSSVAFSPDATVLATGCWDGSVRLWDVASARPLGDPLVHRGRVYALAFSPDGTRLLVGAGSPLDNYEFSEANSVPRGWGEARLWAWAERRPAGPPVRHRGPVLAVGFRPDGRVFATGSQDRTARLWDSATCDPVGAAMEHPTRVWSLAFHPDGKRLLTATPNRQALLWDATSGAPRGTLYANDSSAAVGVNALAYFRGGRSLLSGGWRVAQLRDADSGELLRPSLWGHTLEVDTVALGCDDDIALTGSQDGALNVLSMRSWSKVGLALQSTQTWVNSVSLAQEGRAIAGGAGNPKGGAGEARIWGVGASMARPVRVHHGAPITSAVFRPDGRMFATGGEDSVVRFFDAADGRPARPPLSASSQIESLAFSPDGRILLAATSSGEVYRWIIETGEKLQMLRHPGAGAIKGAFSPDGRLILTAGAVPCRRGHIQLWDAATGRPLGPPIEQFEPHAVLFRPGGEAALIGGRDRTARAWDIVGGASLRPSDEFPAELYSAAFRADGKAIVAGNYDGTAQILDAATGRPLSPPLELRTAGPVYACDYSPDGRLVLTGSAGRTARLWDATTARPVGPPIGHSGAVRAAAFRPDGAAVLTASSDGDARIWPIAPPLEGTSERISLSVETMTGTFIGQADTLAVMDHGTWEERRGRLAAVGGPLWEEPVTAVRAGPRVEVERALSHDNDLAWELCSRGFVLSRDGKHDEAADQLRRAIRIDPDNSLAHLRLGDLLYAQHKLDEAADHFREAIRLTPDDASAHLSLGLALGDRGDAAGADVEYRRAVELNPGDAGGHIGIGRTLLARGDLAGAEASYRRAVAVAPEDVTARNSLGEVLVYRGDLAGAEAEYRRVVAIDPGDVGAHVGLGRVLVGRGDLAGAEAEYRRAIEINPKDAWAHRELGWALMKLGRFPDALAAFRRCHELGSKQPGWNFPSARWVRDCERLVALEPRLPKVLGGEDWPGDDSEAVGFAELCYYARRYVTSSRLYEKALAEYPKLADDLAAGHRYNAACAAALAAAGKGKDEQPPDSEARAKLRARALDWLRAERDAWDKFLGAVGPAAREKVASNLRHWQADADLAGVRDPEALAKLPEAERKDWQALWADVDALNRRAGEPPGR